MKKYISIYIILALLLGVEANAAEINADIVLKNISIDVTSNSATENATLQVVDAGGTKVYYMDEAPFEDGKYAFEDFCMPSDADTGSYLIRIGENGAVSEKEFYYVSYSDVVELLKNIYSEDADISAIVEIKDALLGVSYQDYNSISDGWKARIVTELEKITPDYSGSETVSEAYEATRAVFKKYISYGILTGTRDKNKLAAAVSGTDGLDLTYWDSISDKAYVTECFGAMSVDGRTASDKDVSDSFDGAVLASVIEQCDWGSVKQALTYYVNKGLIKIDSAYLNSGASVYKALKNMHIKDYTKLPDAIKKAYSENGSSAGGGSGSGSGGSGGSGSGSRGASASGVAKASYIPSKETAGQAAVSFGDLTSAEWAREAVEALAAKGVVAGRGNGRFEPDSDLTREEFVKLIVAAFSLEDRNAGADFEDVPKTSWSYLYVASAKRAGIVEGIGDGLFGAEDGITRQDMAVIMHRVANLFNVDMSGAEKTFSDMDTVAGYAKEAVSALSAAGVINGMGNGAFSPGTLVTRAQGAQVIYGLLKKQNGGSY